MSAKTTPNPSITGKRDEDILARPDLTRTLLGAREARQNFARVVNNARIDQSRMVITDHGEPAAAVVPIREWRILDKLAQGGLTDKVAELAIEEMDLGQFFNALANLSSQQGDNGGDPKRRKGK